MKKTHILETDLKTLNGESLIGSGDVIITKQKLSILSDPYIY